MKKTLLSLVGLFYLGSALVACKTNDPAPPDRDQALLAEAQAAGFTYYRRGDTVAAAPPSPHLSFRLRFNAAALTALDSAGNLPAGGVFPTGALVAKEVYFRGTLLHLNVMKKDPTNPDAAGGWQWAEYNANSSVAASVTARGAACLNCHSELPNRDLTRTFNLH